MLEELYIQIVVKDYANRDAGKPNNSQLQKGQRIIICKKKMDKCVEQKYIYIFFINYYITFN